MGCWDGQSGRLNTYQTLVFCEEDGHAGIDLADRQRDQHCESDRLCCLFV